MGKGKNRCRWNIFDLIFLYHTIIGSIPLLVDYSSIRVVGARELTWFIRYSFYWNLQFLNPVFIIKTKVHLPQASYVIANFSYSVYTLWFSSSQFKFFLFCHQIFWLWSFLMKVILQKCVLHTKLLFIAMITVEIISTNSLMLYPHS
jgi:hypothetical protein